MYHGLLWKTLLLVFSHSPVRKLFPLVVSGCCAVGCVWGCVMPTCCGALPPAALGRDQAFQLVAQEGLLKSDHRKGSIYLSLFLERYFE